MRRMYWLSTWVLVVMLVLGMSLVPGCSQSTPTPAPAPATTAKPVPTSTAAPVPAPTVTVTAPAPKPTTAAPAPKPTTAAKPILLTAASGQPDTAVQDTVSLVKYAAEVEKRTSGMVKIKVIAGSALLSKTSIRAGVQAGLADLGTLSIQYDPSIFPMSYPLAGTAEVELGALMNCRSVVYLEWKLWNEFPQLEQDYTKAGLKHLFGIPSPAYAIACKKPIKTFADLKGLKIRVPGAAVGKLLETGGAVPVVTALSDVYTNIQTGVMDGVYTLVDVLIAYKIFEVAPNFIALTPTGGSMPAIFGPTTATMNLDKWNTIPDEYQKIMLETAHDVGLVMADMMQKNYDDSVAFLKKGPNYGFTYWSSEESAKWIAALKQKGDYWDATAKTIDSAGLPGTSYVKRIRELVTDYSTGKWQAEKEYLAAKQ